MHKTYQHRDSQKRFTGANGKPCGSKNVSSLESDTYGSLFPLRNIKFKKKVIATFWNSDFSS